MLLHDLLSEAARTFSDKLAAVFPKEQATFSAIEKQSLQVAARLHKLGIGPGSRVAILYDNTLASLVYYWGILKSGAVTIDIPTLAGQATIESVLEESRPDALAVQQRHLKRIVAEAWSTCPTILFSSQDGKRLPRLSSPMGSRFTHWRKSLKPNRIWLNFPAPRHQM